MLGGQRRPLRSQHAATPADGHTRQRSWREAELAPCPAASGAHGRASTWPRPQRRPHAGTRLRQPEFACSRGEIAPAPGLRHQSPARDQRCPTRAVASTATGCFARDGRSSGAPPATEGAAVALSRRPAHGCEGAPPMPARLRPEAAAVPRSWRRLQPSPPSTSMKRESFLSASFVLVSRPRKRRPTSVVGMKRMSSLSSGFHAKNVHLLMWHPNKCA